ncbi:MAG: iron-containing alcohol dehydrogenase [Chromatiales bacterium]|nr:iron-containing alcohol dehydrogenase [Chromatiales bacterium]
MLGQRSPAQTALGARSRAAGLDVVVYDHARCEPDSDSFEAAAAFARDGAVRRLRLAGRRLGDGHRQGGQPAVHLARRPASPTSTRRSARAKPIPGKLKPHIACPTTCGTGSETTGITIVDLKSVGLKTGIASPLLKPSLAIVDPTTTETLPGGVVAAVRLRRADARRRVVHRAALTPAGRKPAHPSQRPPYQGSTPVQRHRQPRRDPPRRQVPRARGARRRTTRRRATS